VSEGHEQDDALRALGGRWLADVLNDPVPGFLFEGCFRERSITVIEAPAHRGKTLLTLEMAICLDFELPLFGRFQPLRNRRVFYVGADAPSWDYGLQTRKLLIGHNIDPPRRQLLGIAGFYKRGLKITDPDFRAWLKDWRRLSGTDVLILDSHRATHDANENDSSEMKQVWDKLCELRDAGWTVIMTHHIGKQGEVLQADVHAGRGSTIIGDQADFIYTLHKRNRKDTRVQVACVKGRGAADEDDPFSYFDIESVQSDEHLNSRPLWGLRLTASGEDVSRALLEVLVAPTERSGLMTALRAHCPETVKGMTDAQLYRFVDNRLTELRQLGKIRQEERGKWRTI
jgi:hypothetical protein